MTRIISVISGKGGTGKTTTVANVGAALAELDYDVLILDANLTTPNLGLHLGMALSPITLHDVLKRKAPIHKAIYKNKKGLRIIPAGIGIDDLRGIDARDLPTLMLDLVGNVDIILIDGAAGLGRETLSAIESSDETIIVTTPDLPSVTDALKSIKLAEQIGTKVIGVVINRIKNKSHELSREDIESMLEVPILAEISESDAIQESISKRMPIIYHNPSHISSQQFKKLAYNLVGIDYEIKKPWHERLFGFLFK